MRSLIPQILKPLLIVSFLSVVGCDQSFDPRPSGSSSPIVYSILSTDKADQVVRVLSTYPPSVRTPGSNTVEYPITDAVVVIREGATTYPLLLVVLPRSDSSRYTSPIYAYRSSGLTLQYGATYTLEVLIPSAGLLTGTTTIPSKPGVYMDQRSVLEKPQQYDLTQKMLMRAEMSGEAEGYLFRLLVCYDVLEGNNWVRKWTEVPARFRSDPHSIANALYGQVTRVQNQSVANAYTVGVYLQVLDDIYERTKPYKLVFNYAVLQFVQLDKTFYNYYTSVTGFQDPFSIRLDQSNYSNITNGTGIFAGCAVDTVFQILPADFQHNRR